MLNGLLRLVSDGVHQLNQEFKAIVLKFYQEGDVLGHSVPSYSPGLVKRFDTTFPWAFSDALFVIPTPEPLTNNAAAIVKPFQWPVFISISNTLPNKDTLYLTDMDPVGRFNSTGHRFHHVDRLPNASITCNQSKWVIIERQTKPSFELCLHLRVWHSHVARFV